MSGSGDCPNLAMLRDFAAGLLAGEVAATISLHLAGCERCREILAGFNTSEKDLSEEVPAYPQAVGQQVTVADSRNIQQEPTEDSDIRSDLHFLEPSPNPQALGRLGAYEVLNVLGRGGMGVVLKAFDTSLHRTVAIKVLSPVLAANPKAQRRFHREARAAAGINHPNVVTIHAVDEQHGAPYLVMEFIQGQTLRQRIRSGAPFELTTLLRIGTQIAAGLAAAHVHGVIHRDIKPSNIMLEDGIERVKITDFGLALVVMDVGQITSAGGVVGTPAYMAPEQVAGTRVDARADLFSLGCVLYAMVTGRSPFQGNHALDIARRVTDLEPPPLHQQHPAIPRPVSDAIARLLEKDPNRRYQSAEEVRDVLLSYLAPLQGSFPLETPLPGPALPPVRTRPRWFAFGVFALVVLLAVLGLWWGHGLRPGSPPTAPVEAGPGLLTVAHEGKARFRSLREAIAQAGPGVTIRILDQGNYLGPISIDDAERLAGLTIEAPHGATLETNAGLDPVIFIGNTPGITIRGVVIRTRDQQHGISVVGQCEGLTIDQVRLRKPPQSRHAPLVLWPGATGSEDRPVLLRHLDVQCGGLGITVLGKPDQPATGIRVQGCRFSGAGPQLTLETAVRDVIVSENIFTDGNLGVSLRLNAPGTSGLLIANNTFFRVGNWLGLAGCSFDHPEVLVANNLILQGRAIDFGPEGAPAPASRWFRGNWWEPDPRADHEQVRRFAELKASVPLVSRDPASPHFLRPAPRTMPRDHVGALPPE